MIWITCGAFLSISLLWNHGSPPFYENILKIWKCVNSNQARSIFGFTMEDSMGKVFVVTIVMDCNKCLLGGVSGNWSCSCIFYFFSPCLREQAWYSLPNSMRNRPGNVYTAITRFRIHTFVWPEMLRHVLNSQNQHWYILHSYLLYRLSSTEHIYEISGSSVENGC